MMYAQCAHMLPFRLHTRQCCLLIIERDFMRSCFSFPHFVCSHYYIEVVRTVSLPTPTKCLLELSTNEDHLQHHERVLTFNHLSCVCVQMCWLIFGFELEECAIWKCSMHTLNKYVYELYSRSGFKQIRSTYYASSLTFTLFKCESRLEQLK